MGLAASCGYLAYSVSSRRLNLLAGEQNRTHLGPVQIWAHILFRFRVGERAVTASAAFAGLAALWALRML